MSSEDNTEPPAAGVRFSTTPTPPAGARRKEAITDPRVLPPEVAWFKALYIHERRVVEALQSPVTQRDSCYRPSPSLDGGAKSGSIEDKPRKNQWVAAYNKLKPLLEAHKLTPAAYVKLLFWLLRPGATAIPTVQQLASETYLERVLRALDDWTLELQSNFLGETARSRAALIIHTKGNQPKSLSCAVYRTILDRSLGLSALFCYCIAHATIKAVALKAESTSDPAYVQLVELLPQILPHAAEEYAVCPKIYDSIWGDVIPEDFRVAAVQLVQTAIKQCLPS